MLSAFNQNIKIINKKLKAKMFLQQLGLTLGMAHWVLLFFAVMIFNTVSFFFCYFVYKDLSVTHISWGLLFLIPSWAIVAEQAFVTDDP